MVGLELGIVGVIFRAGCHIANMLFIVRTTKPPKAEIDKG